MEQERHDSYQAPPRRRFFKTFVTSIGAAIGGLLGVPLAGFYALPALKKSPTQWKLAGPVDKFSTGEIQLVPLQPLERRQWPEDWGQDAAWVYRRGADDFVVYSFHCTHVGCPVNWSPQAQRFFCPCHGGVFDREGRVLAGPPPRPLDRYEIRTENGGLYAGAVYRVNNELQRVD